MKKYDISHVDARLLKIFLSIYDNGSVSATALQFGVTQSTISHALDRLRDALNDTLFVKQGRGIGPTRTAEDLVPRIRKIVAQIEGLVEHFDYDPMADKQPFTITTNVAELTPELVNVRSNLMAINPEQTLRFIELGSVGTLLPMLDEDRADVALSIRPKTIPAALERHPFLSDPMVVFFDPDIRGPITSVEEYCNARHAALDFGSDKKSIVSSALDKLSLTRKIQIGAANVYSLGQMIKGTDMIATMSARLFHSALSHLEHCPAPITLPPVKFDMFWHRRYSNSPRNIWLRELVANSITPPKKGRSKCHALF
ncbi:MAG: LysR family transcriptional regulator [Paracoccaceae bacterium]|nr:LysR family transcriptional regulator [Paracoccaceae bacterium]